MRDLLRQAARNNALWCDAVCSAQGAPGEFREALWLNRSGTPPYYPDAVTLAAAEAAGEQTEAIASMVSRPRDSGWSVKDSFACLDLAPLGFTVLFDAEWVTWQPKADSAQQSAAGLSWTTVRSETDMQRWRKAWAGEAPAVEPSRIFADGLISDPAVNALLASADDIPLCGGILYEAADVVGMSNVFHTSVEPEAAWRGFLHQAARRFPGRPVVGYETGEELAVARRSGFTPAGPLRIWHRP